MNTYTNILDKIRSLKKKALQNIGMTIIEDYVQIIKIHGSNIILQQ